MSSQKGRLNLNKYIAEVWYLAIRKGSTGDILTNTSREFHVLPLEAGNWPADPFVCVHDGKIYIFAELYDYRLMRGTIAYTIYHPETGTIDRWKKVIVEDYHLSFPYIYVQGGGYYIIPESYQANALTRYKAVHFPDVWEKSTIYQGMELADTALFQDGTRTLGYTLQHHADGTDVWEGNNKSRLFELIDDKVVFEEGFFSDDQRLCRLGGAFFMHNGSLIRVAQNCRDSYGEELIFLKWEKQGGKFHDTEIKTVKASDIHVDRDIFFDGVHTYNSNGGWEIIDLRSKGFRPVQWWWRGLNKAGKILRGRRGQ